jgi:hypothetical protein
MVQPFFIAYFNDTKPASLLLNPSALFTTALSPILSVRFRAHGSEALSSDDMRGNRLGAPRSDDTGSL